MAVVTIERLGKGAQTRQGGCSAPSGRACVTGARRQPPAFRGTRTTSKGPSRVTTRGSTASNAGPAAPPPIERS